MKTKIHTRLLNALYRGERAFFLATLTVLASIALISCEEKDLGKTIELVDPPRLEFRDLAWSPGDRFQATFEVEAIGKEVGDFEIGLGLFGHFDDWVPDVVVRSESFSSKKSEEIVTIEWDLPDNLAPSSEGVYYKLMMAQRPERKSIHKGGEEIVTVTIVERAEE